MSYTVSSSTGHWVSNPNVQQFDRAARKVHVSGPWDLITHAPSSVGRIGFALDFVDTIVRYMDERTKTIFARPALLSGVPSYDCLRDLTPILQPYYEASQRRKHDAGASSITWAEIQNGTALEYIPFSIFMVMTGVVDPWIFWRACSLSPQLARELLACKPAMQLVLAAMESGRRIELTIEDSPRLHVLDDLSRRIFNKHTGWRGERHPLRGLIFKRYPEESVAERLVRSRGFGTKNSLMVFDTIADMRLDGETTRKLLNAWLIGPHNRTDRVL